MATQLHHAGQRHWSFTRRETARLGGFFGAHLRGERDHAAVGDSVAEAVWQLVRLPSAGDGTGAGPAPSGL